MITKIRRILWRILGIDHQHIVRVVDQPFLKNDRYTTVGEGTYNNNALVYRWSDSPLTIGNYCSISYGVKFIVDDGGHTHNNISCYPFRTNPINTTNAGITVGNDVWIGMNVTILYGVKIGDGATIAAGAVVTTDIPPYTVVGGVPAKIIKEKCSREIAKEMQQIAWWKWPKNVIEERIADFQLPFEDFVKKYKK